MEVSREEYKQMKQNARKPHVHAELIKAWADGAEIQVRTNKYTDWVDCTPYWDLIYEYRIKPKTIKYRLYLNRWNRVVAWSNPTKDPTYSFIRWLGDWQEVEV